ncbi:hypothetical protein BJY00DRAFT_154447 [Aspergillus carlsbadensis]|nr:hypothetical protein BJY00DRAFT_154447 [Aspergillus carlsbadensis]
MSDKTFFTKWIGRTIELNTTKPPSAWELVTNLSDKHLQWSAEEYCNDPATSAAYGTFLCKSIKNSDDVAVLRILMQIPYGGSEYAIQAERARQATVIPNATTQDELDAAHLLSKNQCTAAPAIRAKETTVQDDSGLVPGGFISYILQEMAPGTQLNGELFWSYDRKERDCIRDAYKEAWSDWVRSGVPVSTSISHLFWDRGTSKITIASIALAVLLEPGEKMEWIDTEWLNVGLTRTTGPNQERVSRKGDWMW